MLLLDDQDEVRKLQAVTLADIFRERLEELQQRYPSTEGIDDDAGMPNASVLILFKD